MKRASTRLAEIADTAALREWEIRQGRGRGVSQDLPLTRRGLIFAMAAVALFAAVSAIWPMGFAA